MGRLTQAEKNMYAVFFVEYRYCWACKLQPLPSLGGMYGRLENAHIIGGAGRVADRRAINRLCKAHHMLEQGETIRHETKVLPRLTLANMLWLKRQFDAANFDIEFIRDCRKKKNGRHDLPKPVPPEPVWSRKF